QSFTISGPRARHDREGSRRRWWPAPERRLASVQRCAVLVAQRAGRRHAVDDLARFELAFAVLIEGFALADVLHAWDGVATGGLDLLDVDEEGLADVRVEVVGEGLAVLAEGGVVEVDAAAAAVEAEGAGGGVEAGEHDRYAAVVLDVLRGLVAAAGVVDVADEVGAEDAQEVAALRREVRVAVVWVRGRGGDEEEVLALDEGLALGVDGVVPVGHGCASTPRGGGAGMVAESTLPLGNGHTTTYSYDSRYRLSGIVTTNGTITPQDVGYSYDEAGNIIETNDHASSEDLWYKYDALNRLTEMRLGSPSGPLQASYTYDPAPSLGGRLGNMTAKQEGATATPAAMTYNAEHVHAPSTYNGGQLLYDKNGNLTFSMWTETFLYNVENQRAQATNWWYNLVTNYLYDGDGNLVRRDSTLP